MLFRKHKYPVHNCGASNSRPMLISKIIMYWTYWTFWNLRIIYYYKNTNVNAYSTVFSKRSCGRAYSTRIRNGPLMLGLFSSLAGRNPPVRKTARRQWIVKKAQADVNYHLLAFARRKPPKTVKRADKHTHGSMPAFDVVYRSSSNITLRLVSAKKSTGRHGGWNSLSKAGIQY